MNFIYNLFVDFANWAWGLPMLVVIIVGGAFLTFRLGFIQFKRFGYSMNYVKDNLFKGGSEDGISGFQAVATALSGTIGTGNIVGVSMAIAYGGPGAVFWMWVAGTVCMCIKYSEVLASMMFRERRPDGEYSAGPYMYLQTLTPVKPLNKILSIVFAVFLVIALLIAAGTHTGSTVDTLVNVGANRYIATAGMIIIIAVIVYRGLKSVVSFTEKLVPFMSLFYIIAGILIIFFNIGNLVPAFASIFKQAFQPTAAVGGFAGSTIALSMRWGVARGVYSNDSGNGIASILHGQSDTKEPVEQALWGIFEVFFDTIIICTFTALTILVSESWINYSSETHAALLTHYAFTDTLGAPGTILITAALALFAGSTALSFAYLIENQTSSLLGKKAGKGFQAFYFVMMAVGGIAGVDKFMILNDVTNAVNIFIVMFALLVLSGKMNEETQDYFKRNVN